MAFDDVLKAWLGTSRGTRSYSEALSRHQLAALATASRCACLSGCPYWSMVV